MVTKRMDKPSDNKSRVDFPADFFALFSSAIITLIFAVFTGLLFTPLFHARTGDATILWVAIVLTTIGIVLLFVARLPLYRQRRFLTLGPCTLDERHRMIYRWAYRFIGASLILLVMLHLALR